MTNLYYISILRIRNCFKMFSCFIEAIYIHAGWVGEAEWGWRSMILVCR